MKIYCEKHHAKKNLIFSEGITFKKGKHNFLSIILPVQKENERKFALINAKNLR